MESPLFVFIGITEPGLDANLIVLERRLKAALDFNDQIPQYEIKGDILILTLSNPDFRFYLTFAGNEKTIFEDYKQLARDFGMPWDYKPINKSRLEDIYRILEKEGFVKYSTYRETGLHILERMEEFKDVTVFSIPSMKEPTLFMKMIKRLKF